LHKQSNSLQISTYKPFLLVYGKWHCPSFHSLIFFLPISLCFSLLPFFLLPFSFTYHFRYTSYIHVYNLAQYCVTVYNHTPNYTIYVMLLILNQLIQYCVIGIYTNIFLVLKTKSMWYFIFETK
jgi:hypothetical protein